MAADKTLVQGAAMAAPKFVNVAGAFSKNFESTLGEITKATNEANAKRSELINSLDFIQFDENGNTIPMSEAQLAIAKDIRQQVLDDINNGDPFSPKRADSIGKAKMKVQEVAGLANVHKQVIADMQSAKSELSGANDTSAIDRLNAIKNAKLVKDPKTGEYKYEVAGEMLSAQQLAAYPEDIIETPVVAEANIGNTFNVLSKKYTTIDPNDPSKRAQFFGNAEQEVRTIVIQQLNDPAYGNDLRYHALTQGSDYIKNPPYDGITKSGLDEIAITEVKKDMAEWNKANPDKPPKTFPDNDPIRKENFIKNKLNEMVEEAYVNGFKENNPDSKLQPKPVKDTTYKPDKLDKEIAFNKPIVREAKKFVSDLTKEGAKLKGDEKVKQIIKKIKSFSPDNEVALLTRGEAFKKYVEMENNRLKGLTEEERNAEFGKDKKGKQRKWADSDIMKENFRKFIGEKPGINIGTDEDPNVIPNIKSGSGNQIFEFDEFNDGTFAFKPLPVNTKSAKSLEEFLVNYIPMSDEARANFKGKILDNQLP